MPPPPFKLRSNKSSLREFAAEHCQIHRSACQTFAQSLLAAASGGRKLSEFRRDPIFSNYPISVSGALDYQLLAILRINPLRKCYSSVFSGEAELVELGIGSYSTPLICGL